MPDQKHSEVGISTHQLNGVRANCWFPSKDRETLGERQSDVGIGVRSVAQLLGIKLFIFQEALHDLAVPTAHQMDRLSTATFMDIIIRRQFRTEIEALGGYDTTETGKIRQLRPG